MAETTTGLRSILSAPRVYDLAQFLMGSKRARRLVAERYIGAKPGDRVLDIGCGTAEILDYLPGVEYVGYDVSESYIEAAQVKYPQQTFKVGALPDGHDGTFDIVLALGVLHHLATEECIDLFDEARLCLKPGGRIVTVDPVCTGNPLEGLLLALDRGQNIQDVRGYGMMPFGFRQPSAVVVSDLLPFWVPYSHCVMELSV